MSPAGLLRWLDSPPQTNEVARSAVLMCGFLTIAAETGLPLALCAPLFGLLLGGDQLLLVDQLLRELPSYPEAEDPRVLPLAERIGMYEYMHEMQLLAFQQLGHLPGIQFGQHQHQHQHQRQREPENSEDACG